MKLAALAILALLFFVFAIWFIAMPESTVMGLLAEAFGSTTLSLETEGFRKGFFLSFVADKAVLRRHTSSGSVSDTLAVFENVHCSVHFVSLLKLRPALVFDSLIGNGSVSGSADMLGDQTTLVKAKGIEIDSIPVLAQHGLTGQGKLSGSLRMVQGKGDATFDIADARLNNTSFDSALLPLNLFHTVRGALTISPGQLDITSLAMSGKGIHARVKGSVRSQSMNLTLELMADSTFPVDPLIDRLLDRYRVSPGYYLIQVNHTLH